MIDQNSTKNLHGGQVDVITASVSLELFYNKEGPD